MNFASGGELNRFFPYGKVVAYSVIGDPCGKKAFKVRLSSDTSDPQDHGAFLKRVSLLSGLFPQKGEVVATHPLAQCEVRNLTKKPTPVGVSIFSTI
jgi:hypothetical protein